MKCTDLLLRLRDGMARRQRSYRYRVWKELRRKLVKSTTAHWAYYLVIVSLLAVGLLSLHHYLQSHLYVVRLDGVEVGLVEDTAEVEQFLEALMDQCCLLYGMEVKPKQNISFTREFLPGRSADVRQVEAALRQQVHLITEAVMVKVNGIPVAPVSTQQEIKKVINALSLAFISQEDNVKLREVSLVEDVDGECCVVDPEQVCTAEEVAALMIASTKEARIEELAIASRDFYLSRTGRNNASGETVSEPETPLVHVITVEEAFLEEPIPYSTTYMDNSNMWRGESRVVTPGEDGRKEVVYRVTRENGEEIAREVVSERVVMEPVSQVVERGTGSRFAWPVAGGGRISQGFRGLAHIGIDIAAPLGTTILAADSGVVIRSAWGPAEGNYVILYHGDYWTVYLHNSRNLVSAGERVSRGQAIALLGSTGNSTGPHLHFEVRRSTGSSAWVGFYDYTPLDPLSFY